MSRAKYDSHEYQGYLLKEAKRANSRDVAQPFRRSIITRGWDEALANSSCAPHPITMPVNPIRSSLFFTAMPQFQPSNRTHSPIVSNLLWAIPLKSTFQLRRHGLDKALNLGQCRELIMGAILGIPSSKTLNRNRHFGRKFRYHDTS